MKQMKKWHLGYTLQLAVLFLMCTGMAACSDDETSDNLYSVGFETLQSDNTEFMAEMKEIEAEEKECMNTVFKNKELSDAEKEPYVAKLKDIRARKLDWAKQALHANPGDKRFVDVLNFYIFNFLTIDELNTELERFTSEARTNPMWKSMKDYVTYKPLNAVGKDCFDFTVKGHDGQEIRLSDVLKQNKLVLVDF